MDLTLYLTTASGTDIRCSSVLSLTDNSQIPLPPLVFNDRLNLTIYLVDGIGGYNVNSGLAGLSPRLALGARGQSALAITDAFTAITNGWTTVLDLTTNELLQVIASQRSGSLTLEFSTTGSGPNKTTWASLAAEVIGYIDDPVASTDPAIASYSAAQVDALLALKQPLDADLTALSGLPTAADTLPYFTGIGAAALTPFLAYGRSLVGAANAAAAKTTLALVKADVGLSNVDNTADINKPVSTAQAAADTAVYSAAIAAVAAAYQPLDSDLTAIAALSTTANGRSLLTATALSAAGLGLTNGANIDAWGAKTIFAGNVAVTAAKTLTATNTLTFAGTDGSTLNVGAGGTLGSAAYTASTAYVPAWAGLTTNGLLQATSATAVSSTLTPAGLTSLGVNSLTAAAATDLTLNAGSGNQNVFLAPTGTGYATTNHGFNISGSANSPASGQFVEIAVSGGTKGIIRAYDRTGAAALPLALNDLGGNVLVGTTTDSSNGRLQLATHTTSAGGIGFGTDVSLYRGGANNISANGGINSQRAGSNTLGLGSGFGLYDATAVNGVLQQLNASYGIDFWGLAASTWTKRATISNTGAFSTTDTTASTSMTTGSATFGGGIGVTGAAWVGGTGNFAGIVTAQTGITIPAVANGSTLISTSGTGYASYQQLFSQQNAANSDAMSLGQTGAAYAGPLASVGNSQVYIYSPARLTIARGAGATNGFHFDSTAFTVTPTTDATTGGAGSITTAGGIYATKKIIAGTSYSVGANQVVGARVTGYAAMTGTPDKATAFATGSVTLAQLAGRVMQLQADLTTHGLIGP